MEASRRAETQGSVDVAVSSLETGWRQNFFSLWRAQSFFTRISSNWVSVPSPPMEANLPHSASAGVSGTHIQTRPACEVKALGAMASPSCYMKLTVTASEEESCGGQLTLLTSSPWLSSLSGEVKGGGSPKEFLVVLS